MLNNFLDKLCANAQIALHTLSGVQHSSTRTNPADKIYQDKCSLDSKTQKHIGALMRINHTGEVCAQALYQGQALFSSNKSLQQSMQIAANEELDHLNWCKTRLNELNAHSSYLNVFWYTGSLMLGGLTSLTHERWNLGFLAETEKQVTSHLQEHLLFVPVEDQKTRAILEQMIIDEQAHATTAIEQGGAELPAPIKYLMSVSAKMMKSITYYV